VSEKPLSNFGVLLVNLGTPETPDAKGVRNFLKPFLWDPRVVDVPRPIWWLILNLIILPLRSPRVARLYKSIWTEEGSPLLVISRKQQAALADNLASRLGLTVPVELAMTYSSPLISEALVRLQEQEIHRVLVIPMYPQYSATTTGAVYDAVFDSLKNTRNLPELRFIKHYFSQADYIGALEQSVRDHWDKEGQPEKLLMSFHGIPCSFEEKGDPYPSECRETARLLATRLQLPDDQWAISFQSRVGREEWIKPYTDVVLADWGQNGVKRVDVVCPAFSVDCLETLEEIDVENREIFIGAGGKSFHYIPCLNDREDHINALAHLAIDNLKGWTSQGNE